jgi:hypothetical protein
MKNSKNLLHYLTNRLRVLHTHTYATEHMFCTVSTLQLYFFLDVLLYYPHVYYTGEGTSERAGACLFLQNQVTTTTGNTRTCIKLYVSLLRVIFTCQHVFASCCNRGQPCTLFTVFGQFFHQCWLCFGTSIPMTQRRGSTHHP